MKRLIFWLVRPMVRMIVVGKTIAVIEETGATAYEGTIISVTMSLESVPRVIVMPFGGSVGDVRRIELLNIRFNAAAMRFEVESKDAMERNPGQRPGDHVEGRGNDPRDSQEAGQAPQHNQSASSEARPTSTPNGRPHGESEGGVRARHDADTSSEGEEGGADHPVADTEPGAEGHWGAMIRMGANPSIPPGTLIGVTPGQHLHIVHVGQYSGGLPGGSIIWGHPQTISQIRGSVPSESLH